MTTGTFIFFNLKARKVEEILKIRAVFEVAPTIDGVMLGRIRVEEGVNRNLHGGLTVGLHPLLVLALVIFRQLPPTLLDRGLEFRALRFAV